MISKCVDDRAKNVCNEYLSRIKDSAEKEDLGGDVVYALLKELSLEIEKSHPNWTHDFLKIMLKPEHFVTYLNKAGEDYAAFPVSSEKEILSNYLIQQIASRKNVVNVLDLLKKDSQYSLMPIYERVKEEICSPTTKKDDCDYLFDHLRATAVQLISFEHRAISQLVNIYNNVSIDSTQHHATLDLYVILAKHGQNVSILPETRLAGLEAVIWNYITCEELINMVASNQYALSASLLSYCIKHSVANDEIVTDEILLRLSRVKEVVRMSIPAIIKYFELYMYKSNETLDVDLEIAFPNLDWLREFIVSSSDMADMVCHRYLDKIERLDVSSLCEANGSFKSNNYWVGAIEILFENGKYKKNIPPIFKQVAGRLIEAIARGVSFAPDTQNLIDIIIGSIHYQDVSTSVDNALRSLLTDQTISLNKYVQLHKWFEKTNVNDNSDSSTFLNRVINPILPNPEFHTMVCANKEFYFKLFNNHLESDSILKDFCVAVKVGEKETSEEFKEFVMSIDIMDDVEQEVQEDVRQN